jgi:hypothetical protein
VLTLLLRPDAPRAQAQRLLLLLLLLLLLQSVGVCSHPEQVLAGCGMEAAAEKRVSSARCCC